MRPTIQNYYTKSSIRREMPSTKKGGRGMQLIETLAKTTQDEDYRS